MEIKQSKYTAIRLRNLKQVNGCMYVYDGNKTPIAFNISIIDKKDDEIFDLIFQEYISSSEYPQNGWMYTDMTEFVSSRIYFNTLDKPETKPTTKFSVGDMVYITKAGINSNKFRIKAIETLYMGGKYHIQYYFSENMSKESFIGWEENLTLWTSSW